MIASQQQQLQRTSGGDATDSLSTVSASVRGSAAAAAALSNNATNSPNAASIPPTPERNQRSSDDDVSDFTVEHQSVRSSRTSFSSRVVSVITDAAMILSGEVPTARPEDEHPSSPGRPGEIMFGETKTRGGSVRSSSSSSSSSSAASIDFLRDDPRDMTWSRRLALRWMRRSKLYNPRLGAEEAFDEAEIEKPGESALPGKHDKRSGSAPPESATPSAVGAADTNDAYPFTHCRRNNPSLEKSWAYWEHVSLSRFVVQPKPDGYTKKNLLLRCLNKFRQGNKQLLRAEPGEKYLNTALYHPIWTPHDQLGDWGLGFGLYFSTLRAIMVITLLAGVLNTPNYIYFRSEEYSQGQPGVNDIVRGSAVCTDTQWVPCTESCTPDNFHQRRIALGTNNVTGTEETFALLNKCNGATLQQGYVNYATLFFVMIGIAALLWYTDGKEVAFDEDEQTAQDYSIIIENPPGDATDPEEWRRFFFENFDGAVVTCCTVAVDNDLLVRSLAERREKLKQIELKLEPGTSMDTLTVTAIAAAEERERRFFGHLLATVVPGIPELFGRVVVLNSKVQGLAQQDYPATNVFVTFETERDQRRVLTALNYPAFDVKRNRTAAALKPQHLFRGERLLKVSEPDEPNTVRWRDLNEKFGQRLKQQFFTLVATLAAIALMAFLVHLCNEKNATFSAFAIAIFNSIFPIFGKILTSLESHGSEGGMQRSLYYKIALFRWVNTAIVITIIYPFTDTLVANGGLIDQIYTLFFAEIITTNVIQLVDPVGHLQRHLLAPRAPTQDAMDISFLGQQVELAERYTNMTKILFLALWYCAIYPAALFLCSLAMFINYFADRFSLMRTWKRAPQLGTQISRFSREYFFPFSILAMAILSSYWWAGFPYDNLCKNDGDNATVAAGAAQYEGTWIVRGSETVTVQGSDPTFRYCSQDFFRMENIDGPSFPFLAAKQPTGDEWMTPEQETITTVYGWTSLVVLCVVVGILLFRIIYSLLAHFRATYDPCGEDQGIPFSEVPTISTYIPQVESHLFAYPLLACKIDGLDEKLFDWTDPDRPYSFYDLTKDAEVLLRGTQVSSAKAVFSRIAHWPPPPPTAPTAGEEAPPPANENYDGRKENRDAKPGKLSSLEGIAEGTEEHS